MAKEPAVPIPGTDEVSDGGDGETLDILDMIEKIGGKGDKRISPPPPQDIPEDEIRTPQGMP